MSYSLFGYNDPFLSPNEEELYFISDRSMDGTAIAKDIDIWSIKIMEEGLSDPINAGPVINSLRNEYYISFTE